MTREQLVEELSRTIDTMKVLSEIGKTITSTIDIKEALRIIMANVHDLFAPTSWSLLILDETNGTLRYEMLINEPYIDGSLRLPLSGNIPGVVAYSGRALLHPGALPDGIEFPGNDVSILCAPLRCREKTLGVIEIKRKGSNHTPYSPNDLTKMCMIADFAAIAMENAQTFRRIEELTIMDDLTPLYNSRHLYKMIEEEIIRSTKYNKNFSVIFIDLDHFKEVVDKYGHAHGSQLLKETADVIRRSIRDVDIGFRYGGDEYVILLPETSKEKALIVANRLREEISKHSYLTNFGMSAHLTASMGVVGFPQDARTKEDLIRMADDAMYNVKRSTRDGVKAV